jgi:hypothetical protein
VIRPGETSDPFPDFDLALDGLTPEQQDQVMGRDNWTLFRAGLVTWADVVRKGRIRRFEEVMSVKHLAYDDMVRAGVPEATVRTAWESVYTPERLANVARQKEIIENLKAAGMSREEVVRYVADRLAARIVTTRKPGSRDD